MEILILIPLRGMKLQNVKNKGKMLFNNLRLTNNTSLLNGIINSEGFIVSFGKLDSTKNVDTTFIYGKYNFSEADLDYGMKILYKMMDDVRTFILLLWFIKDNNVNIEKGFMMIMDGEEFVYSGKTIMYQSFSNSSCHEENLDIFLDSELNDVLDKFETLTRYKSEGNKKIEFHNAYNNDLSIYDRAFHLLHMARREQTLIFRIADYTRLLECLLSTSPNSSSNQISTRAALLIRDNYNDRIALIKFLKQMYAIRSVAYHGDTLSSSVKKKYTYEELLLFSSEYDEIIRCLFRVIEQSDDLNDMYNSSKSDSNGRIDEYFSKIIFSK